MTYILEAVDLNTFYGRSHILFDVGLSVDQGETVCLMGRNGAGKTTTFRSIMGLTPPTQRKGDFQGEGLHKVSLLQNGKDGARVRARGPPYIVVAHGLGKSGVREDKRPSGTLDHGNRFGPIPYYGRYAKSYGGNSFRRRTANAHYCQGAHEQS